MPVKIPDALISAVTQQSAVLFLGAAASYGAGHPEGKKIPGAEDLKTALSNQFLGGKLKERSLSHVAEMCISETDLITVQAFIRDIFLPFSPAKHHEIIPKFFWHAVVTTNYDLIIEKTYAAERSPRQELTTFLKDSQQFDTELKKKKNGVPYVKLHGSIDRVDDHDIPLILANEQYSKYSRNRRRLFNFFQNTGYEFPIVFCGYAVADAHIQNILFDLSDNAIRRPRYYIVDPSLDDVERRYWESHRITCINATFEDFLTGLDSAIPETSRSIPVSLGGGDETVRKFYRVSGAPESAALSIFLADDMEHVRPGIVSTGATPRQFYTGYDDGWGPIEAELDIRRRVTDSILVDAVLAEENQRQNLVDLHVLKGPAGHGKTITLKRVAWEAATSFDMLCLYLKKGGTLRLDAVRELYDLVQQRFFIFVDHAALHMDEILELIVELKSNNIPATIVTAERNNEWNARCGPLDEHVSLDYALRPLSEREIDELLIKLEEHGSLGRLTELTYEDRFNEFAKRAERQLLVALHEATLGKPFEEIVEDEFSRIIPAEAQTLYLDVCTLNRLGVGVRAGLISRISGIRFEDFRERFLTPLELVVRSYEDPYVGDRMYSARHSHVADLVFQLVLNDAEARFDQIVRVLDGMNLSYSTDSEAFRGLIRGREVAQLFASYELGSQFYERALAMAGEDPSLLQQRAIFEMQHAGGSLKRAEKYLSQALEKAPHNRSIQHTYANLKRVEANKTDNPVLRDKLRKDARRHLSELVGSNAKTPHAFHTQALLLIDELRELLTDQDPQALDGQVEKQVVDLVRKIESTLSQGGQQFPEEENLITAEADFRLVLRQSDRAADALKRAFGRNPRSEWVAKRYADHLVTNSNPEEAKDVLRRCLKENPGSKAANFALARMYMKYGNETDKNNIIHLLRRSFSEGDSNLDAQFWYARELFISGSLEDASKRFRGLRHAPVSPSTRMRVRGLIRDAAGNVKRFPGAVTKKEETYLFASCEGFPQDVYANVRQASEEVWEQLRPNRSVELEIGFNMLGPAAAAVFLK